ncbi:MAG: hypothetical protein EA404_07545 [Spirochaetaceae bacterium]|nr:MAG: hypothetical protein EA404_07545 [Spirochaetaceae bacterium]
MSTTLFEGFSQTGVIAGLGLHNASIIIYSLKTDNPNGVLEVPHAFPTLQVCMKYSTLLLLSALVALLCGCELVGGETDVILSLPSLPGWLGALPEDVGYQVEWLDASGQAQRRTIAAASRQMVVRLPKLYNTAVLVYAVIPGDGNGSPYYRLLPGGALFPHHVLDSGRMTLSWSAGAVACVMRELSVLTGHPERYNAVRLQRELEQRTGGNPWSVNLEALVAQLLSGEFRVTSIRPAEKFRVGIAVPAGVWYSENLLRPAEQTVAPQEMPLLELELTRGMHRLFHASGGWVLNVVIEDDGTPRWTLLQRGARIASG